MGLEEINSLEVPCISLTEIFSRHYTTLLVFYIHTYIHISTNSVIIESFRKIGKPVDVQQIKQGTIQNQTNLLKSVCTK